MRRLRLSRLTLPEASLTKNPPGTFGQGDLAASGDSSEPTPGLDGLTSTSSVRRSRLSWPALTITLLSLSCEVLLPSMGLERAVIRPITKPAPKHTTATVTIQHPININCSDIPTPVSCDTVSSCSDTSPVLVPSDQDQLPAAQPLAAVHQALRR